MSNTGPGMKGVRWLYSVAMPWPPAALSPNARLHWAKKAGAVKRFRAVAAACVAAHPGPRLLLGPLLLDLTFHPPTAQWRDRDNLLAAFKAGIDGLAQGLGIDDRRFEELMFRVAAPRRGGAVLARVACVGGLEDCGLWA